MSRLLIFYRLMVRPLYREPVRLALTVFAVALGVAVVLAIDLAGNAAAGSFHSSMETLAGDNDLEIVAAGGVPESVFGMLSRQPYSLRLSPRIEDYAVVAETKQTLSLIGIDFIAEGSRYVSQSAADTNGGNQKDSAKEFLRHLEEPTSIWVGSSLKQRTGNTVALLINDQSYLCIVRGMYPDSSGSESVILMDIAGAQRALRRFGRIDRVLVKLPKEGDFEEWRKRIEEIVPTGVEVRAQGTGTAENRKMLTAFRWNLRLLSYIALVVGAFLIFNTISVSVVRRRGEIGIVRALGATQGMVLTGFLSEAACLGIAGALLGLPLGRLMAEGTVKLIAVTVEALYVSSRPGPIALTPWSVALAFLIGIGVAVVSAISPAREAMTGRTCGCNGQGATRIRGTNPQRARLTNCLDTGNSRSGSCKAACGRGQGAVRLFSHAPVDCGISVCHPCSSEFSFADDYEVSQEDAGRGRAVGVAQPGRFVATNFCVGGCTFHRNSHDGFRRNNGRELSANGVDVDERSTAG